MSRLDTHPTNIAAGIVLALAGLLLGSCAPLQPLKPTTMNTYALDVQFEPAAPATGILTLLVNTPTAQPGLNSPRMFYIKRAHEVDYFSQNQWVDSPARMLAPLLVQALEHTAQYRAVVQPHSGIEADRRLDTEIIRFQHEFLTRPSQIHLTMRAQLVDIREKRVIATREFDITEAAASDAPYGGVTAANRAVKIMLQQIAAFCVQENIGGEPRNTSR